MLTFLKRLVATVLIPCVALAGLPLMAQAGIVSTEQALSAEAADANRDLVTSFLTREDVRAELQAQGLSAADAVVRV